jgi:hypothetical protein
MPKILRLRGLNNKERMVIGVLTREMEFQTIIHSSFLHGHRCHPGSLYTYAAQQSYQLSLYTYFLPTSQTIWHK